MGTGHPPCNGKFFRSSSNLQNRATAENLYRKEMLYWEHDNLVKEIHELEQQIHGVKAPGPGIGHSMQDTGDMLGVSKMHVSSAIKRAEARELFPALFEKCKTQADASKVIKQMDEKIIREALAQKIRSEQTDTKLIDLEKRFIISDFFEGVELLPNDYFNLVEIDPPYAIDLKEVKKKETISQYNLDDYNEISSDRYQVFLANLFLECYKKMSKNSWLICWFAPEPWFETIYKELSNAGFTTTRMCGVWRKPSGQNKRPELYLANSYEMFFYAWKGRPVINRARGNVFDATPVAPQNKIHPTERPIELMQEIYDTFCFTGSKILIPFLGSGNGILAAHRLGMDAYGFELSQAYKDSFIVNLHKKGVVGI